jgi:hypothetical protein
MKIYGLIFIGVTLIILDSYAVSEDSVKISRIDSLVAKLDKSLGHDSTLLIYNTDECNCKMCFGIITKWISASNYRVVQKDTIIFMISRLSFTKKKHKTLKESYYYENNELILYFKYESIQAFFRRFPIIQCQVQAYFSDNEIIGLVEKNDFKDYHLTIDEKENIIEKADSELKLNLISEKNSKTSADKCCNKRMNRKVKPIKLITRYNTRS